MVQGSRVQGSTQSIQINMTKITPGNTVKIGIQRFTDITAANNVTVCMAKSVIGKGIMEGGIIGKEVSRIVCVGLFLNKRERRREYGTKRDIGIQRGRL